LGNDHLRERGKFHMKRRYELIETWRTIHLLYPITAGAQG
jgi:hypothetical protein